MDWRFFIANRYFFSKTSTHLINIITIISVVAVTAVSAAFIIILSAINGLEGVVSTLYGSFDPDIKITAQRGKIIDLRSFPEQELRKILGVEYFVKTLEDHVLLRYDDEQCVAVLKGVEEDFIALTGLERAAYAGTTNLMMNDRAAAVLGAGVASRLEINTGKPYPLVAYYPKKKGKNFINIRESFRSEVIYPTGIFNINHDINEEYVIVPFGFALSLFDVDSSCSAVEIGLTEGKDPSAIKQQIEGLLNKSYEVKTRFELNELIFKTSRSEKFYVFLILSFVMIIAVFTAISSLIILMAEKKKDIGTLQAMGAAEGDIRIIFFYQGMFINFCGGVAGIFAGMLFCVLQMNFGLVRMSGAIVEYYPVSPEGMDFIYVMTAVTLIGLLASWLPVRTLKKNFQRA